MIHLRTFIVSDMDMIDLVKTTGCIIFTWRYRLQKLVTYSGNLVRFKGNVMGLVLGLVGQKINEYESKSTT